MVCDGARSERPGFRTRALVCVWDACPNGWGKCLGKMAGKMAGEHVWRREPSKAWVKPQKRGRDYTKDIKSIH